MAGRREWPAGLGGVQEGIKCLEVAFEYLKSDIVRIIVKGVSGG